MYIKHSYVSYVRIKNMNNRDAPAMLKNSHYSLHKFSIFAYYPLLLPNCSSHISKKIERLHSYRTQGIAQKVH